MTKYLFYSALFILLSMNVSYPEHADNSVSVMSKSKVKLPIIKKDTDFSNIIDCDYKISPEVSKIDLSIILSWAEYAAIQSFTIDFASLDVQLKKLQSCYTDKGWVQLKNALLKSNNLETIKTEKLIVKAERDGQAQIIEALDNRWKINLPIKVVYQNEKERVTHFLNIYLSIGWKNKDGLGIMQMIAIPRMPPLAQKITPANEAIKSMSIILAERKETGVDSAKKITVSVFKSLFSNNAMKRDIALNNKIRQKADIIPQIPNKMLLNPTHVLVRGQPINLPESPKFKDVVMPEQWQVAGVSHFAKLALNDFNSTNRQSNRWQRIYLSESPKFTDIIMSISEQRQVTDVSHSTQITLNDFINNRQNVLLSWLDQTTKSYFESTTKQVFQQLSSWHNLAPDQFIRVKSDDHEVIENQKPILSAQVEGDAQFIETKENQWDIKLPIKVVYQKDKEKIIQRLDVNLTLNQKMIDNLVGKDQSASSSNLLESLKSVLASSSPRALTQLLPGIQNTQLMQSEQSKPEENISCGNKISPETIKMDKNIILRWAEQAVAQSFAFDFSSVDSQLQKLESCYTENGWIEFNAAMQKSGNINAIKMQKLTMYSQINGRAELIETNDNQWRIALPLKVTYTNSTMRVSQLLKIQLTVGKKINGELGIIQLIATLNTSSAPS